MSEDPPLVLVIEDEKPMRNFLESSLIDESYRVELAETGEHGLSMARSHRPDLIILDLGLPDTDGLTVIERLREWTKTPIVILSARGEEEIKVKALDRGADDYLTKPFGVEELMARLRVELRHSLQKNEDTESIKTTYRIKDLEVELEERRVTKNDQEIDLTPTEYRLLVEFVKNTGKVLTHRHLLKEVWGPQAVDKDHYLRVYVGNLRKKIEDDPARPKYLLTEQGVGYRLVDE
ncbi:MAG: response regulator [bacterium]